jgi:hypothetical protein
MEIEVVDLKIAKKGNTPCHVEIWCMSLAQTSKKSIFQTFTPFVLHLSHKVVNAFSALQVLAFSGITIG